MKKQVAAIAVVLAAGSLFAGCGTASETASPGVEADPQPADTDSAIAKLRAERAEKERIAEEAGLTFTLDIEASHIVRFTLPENSDVLLVGERMLLGQSSVLQGLEAFTVGEIVDKLKHGTVLPERFEAFRDARPLEDDGAVDQASEEAVPGALGTADLSKPDDAPIEKHVTNSGAHHRDDHHNCPTRMNYGGSPIAGNNTACELNMVSVSRTVNATHSGTVVATYRGSTSVSYFYDGVFQGSITILQGEINWWAAMSGQFRECVFWSCGEWQVRSKPHRWATDSSMSGGAHHYGAVWVRRASATRGLMTPIFG